MASDMFLLLDGVQGESEDSKHKNRLNIVCLDIVVNLLIKPRLKEVWNLFQAYVQTMFELAESDC